MAGELVVKKKLDRKHSRLSARYPQRNEACDLAEPPAGAVDHCGRDRQRVYFRRYFKVVDTSDPQDRCGRFGVVTQLGEVHDARNGLHARRTAEATVAPPRRTARPPPKLSAGEEAAAGNQAVVHHPHLFGFRTQGGRIAAHARRGFRFLRSDRADSDPGRRSRRTAQRQEGHQQAAALSRLRRGPDGDERRVVASREGYAASHGFVGGGNHSGAAERG